MLWFNPSTGWDIWRLGVHENTDPSSLADIPKHKPVYIHLTSICVLRYILPGWHLTPDKLSKMYKVVSNVCWKCKQFEGAFYHLCWTCKKAETCRNQRVNSEDTTQSENVQLKPEAFLQTWWKNRLEKKTMEFSFYIWQQSQGLCRDAKTYI